VKLKKAVTTLQQKIQLHQEKVKKDKEVLQSIEKTGKTPDGKVAPISMILKMETMVIEEMEILEHEIEEVHVSDLVIHEVVTVDPDSD